ncbi:hypothetical protein PVK06_019412 [Gossypium arboreum]|uniref:Auxin-responsive protein n=1 Tax=Gossypium arboreum TaxID=29729 RepID=A0ABR0PJZ3_GOSAR|nr:hypothetical protein PVK06_019412 [Gossypium arboreum]
MEGWKSSTVPPQNWIGYVLKVLSLYSLFPDELCDTLAGLDKINPWWFNLAVSGWKNYKKCDEDDYILTYQDKEGEWLIAGDIPWQFKTGFREGRKMLMSLGSLLSDFSSIAYFCSCTEATPRKKVAAASV